MKIAMDSQVFKSPDSENHLFRVWSVCVTITNITPKQIIAETPNLSFYICIICRCNMLLETFSENQTIGCVKRHTKELENIMAYRQNVLSVHI